MKRTVHFFRSLRGKLILTYTAVTVLALLALEVLVLSLLLAIFSLNNSDKGQYLSDVIFTLYPQARYYLQPGEEDLPQLQGWLDQVYANGFASLEPQGFLDSPAAPIVRSDPIYVLSLDGTVLAQAPQEGNSLVGRPYTTPDISNSQPILENAFQSSLDPLSLSTLTPAGDYLMAVPVLQAGRESSLVGVIVLTVEPPPPLIMSVWPVLLGAVLVTGLLLLLGVAPFAALFGFVMSHGLNRRLRELTRAADAWSEGDFALLPQDHSGDEIGHLGMRMRHMAGRIQALLQTRHELALMEERNRLARELHDTVKQQAFATLMQVRAAKNLLEADPQGARQHLEQAEGLVKASQQELGRVISELRPTELESGGLVKALGEHLQSWSQHNRIQGGLQVQGERRLPLPVEQAAFRIAQEALANASRHSRASEVTVRLVFSADSVCLEVSDNGVGFQPGARQELGVGLQSMHERASALGGKLFIESHPGQGATVRMVIPVNQEEQA